MFWQASGGDGIESGVGQGAGSADYSSILTSLDVATAVVAIIAAAVLIAVLLFAAWAAKKVAKFFDGATPLARNDDPHFNKDLYLRMQATERTYGNVRGYSGAQQASYEREKKS